jgi:hypothetical protein
MAACRQRVLIEYNRNYGKNTTYYLVRMPLGKTPKYTDVSNLT